MIRLDENTFVPVETEADFDYVCDIVREEEDKDYTREETRDILNRAQGHYWLVMKDGVRVGAIMYMLSLKDEYYMEAIKDQRTTLSQGIGIGFSIRVGKLFVDYLLDKKSKVFTIARVKDKGIQIACRKLGFEEMFTRNNLIFYKKEKVLCQ